EHASDTVGHRAPPELTPDPFIDPVPVVHLSPPFPVLRSLAPVLQDWAPGCLNLPDHLARHWHPRGSAPAAGHRQRPPGTGRKQSAPPVWPAPAAGWRPRP